MIKLMSLHNFSYLFNKVKSCQPVDFLALAIMLSLNRLLHLKNVQLVFAMLLFINTLYSVTISAKTFLVETMQLALKEYNKNIMDNSLFKCQWYPDGKLYTQQNDHLIVKDLEFFFLQFELLHTCLFKFGNSQQNSF